MNRAQRVIAFLEARPNVWIPATAFESIGGRQAWRTAISEARAILLTRGADIKNQTRTMRDGERTWTLSEYRLVPAPVAETAPASGHDLNTWSLT